MSTIPAWPVPLPDNWNIISLSDIVESRLGLTAKGQKQEDEIVYLRITDLGDNGEIAIREPRYISASTPNWQRFQVQEGDLLVARTGSPFTIGKSALFRGDGSAEIPSDFFGNSFVCASYLFRLRPRTEHVLPEYLAFYFQSRFYRHAISTYATQFTQTNLSLEQLNSFVIPLPSGLPPVTWRVR